MTTSAPNNHSASREAETHSLGYIVLLATITAISGLLFGYNTGVINGVLLFLRRQFTPSDLQAEVAVSSLLVGALLGAACASIIGDRYGRKRSLMFSAVLLLLFRPWPLRLVRTRARSPARAERTCDRTASVLIFGADRGDISP